MTRQKKLLLMVAAIVVVVVLLALGAWSAWLSFDYDMQHPQESEWMD
ncbi:hypothetical protein [Saccharopolyspora terrae]|nr:hypothetical protein [Saccharopolyspora terrae]